MRFAGNPSAKAGVFHQPLLFLPIAETVRRCHSWQDTEGVKRNVRMGGAEFLQEVEKRVLVVDCFFRLSRGEEAAVQ